MSRLHVLFAVSLIVLIATHGCSPPKTANKDDKDANAQADDGTGIFGKKTQDIIEFDPAIHTEMVNEKGDVNLITGALGAYGPATEKIAGMGVTRALELFRATHDRYPKSHKEFMDKIVKQNGLKLPMLRTNRRYAYDVSSHEIKIIEKTKQ